jgi:hypothetical protein
VAGPTAQRQPDQTLFQNTSTSSSDPLYPLEYSDCCLQIARIAQAALVIVLSPPHYSSLGVTFFRSDELGFFRALTGEHYSAL